MNIIYYRLRYEPSASNSLFVKFDFTHHHDIMSKCGRRLGIFSFRFHSNGVIVAQLRNWAAMRSGQQRLRRGIIERDKMGHQQYKSILIYNAISIIIFYDVIHCINQLADCHYSFTNTISKDLEFNRPILS